MNPCNAVHPELNAMDACLYPTRKGAGHHDATAQKEYRPRCVEQVAALSWRCSTEEFPRWWAGSASSFRKRVTSETD